MTSHQVIPAEPTDAATLSQVIAEAFHDLAPARWLISDPAARRQIFPRYFRIDTGRKARNHIRQLQALGYTVTITQAA